MPPTQAETPQWMILTGIVIGFPIVFTLIWSFVCLLLSSIGGWGRLAQRFAAQQPPAGQAFKSQSGRFGVVNYNHVLSIHTSPAGLHLDVFLLFRIGHKPLLIPWGEIHHLANSLSFFTEYVVFEVGTPCIAKVRLPKQVFVGQPVLLDGKPVLL